MQQLKDKFASLPLELREHGFIQVLSKRVNENSKLIEEIKLNETKQKSGVKLTAIQLQAIGSK